MKEIFDRRIFTPEILLGDIWFLFTHLTQMIGMIFNEDINKAFIEKTMSVVTAVNGCAYCAWFHAKQAVVSGLSEEEIKNLMSLQFEADASDFELTALLYAQHYAETNRNPDEEMTRKLFDDYGQKTATHIRLIIRMIFFGNLLGNTFDAFLSRVRGVPAENSSLLFEVIFFFFTAPLMYPAKWMMQSGYLS
jgi:AhpD family alkylhydroperoxidase